MIATRCLESSYVEEPMELVMGLSGTSRTTTVTQEKTSSKTAVPQRVHSSTASQASTFVLSLFWESLRGKGLLEKTCQVLMASWRGSTHKQYAGYLQKWQSFYSGRQVDMFSSPVEKVLLFLTELFEASFG